MNAYTGILALHGVLVVALAVGLGMEWQLLFQSRSVSAGSSGQHQFNTAPAFFSVQLVSLVAIQVTGVYLTSSGREWISVWPKAASVGVVLIAIASAYSTRSLLRERSEESGRQTSGRKSALLVSASIRSLLVVGTLLLTAIKPALPWASLILLIPIVAGTIIGNWLGQSSRKSMAN